jgi:hypothetical protein
MAHDPNHPTIPRLEKIARDLAAVLSPQGEADWRRFVVMAEEVGTRLYQQLAQFDSGSATWSASVVPRAGGFTRSPQREHPSQAGDITRARPRLSAAA